MKARAVILLTSLLLPGAQSARAETLNCTQTLNFGIFAACGMTQSATVSPSGGISTTGCLTPLGGHMPGRCRLSDITDTSVIMITGDGDLAETGGKNMNIDQFMLQPLSGGGPAQSTLDVTSDLIGTDFDFAVGARLHIDGAQQSGLYNGTYTLTINFP